MIKSFVFIIYNLFCYSLASIVPLRMAQYKLCNKNFWQSWAIKKEAINFFLKKIYSLRLLLTKQVNASFFTNRGFLITTSLYRDRGISRMLLFRGSYETATEEIIEKVLPIGGTFIDCGAHIGTLTLTAAQRVGPQGTIIAIEPNPQLFAYLKKNCSQNHYHNIIIENVAIGRDTGMHTFLIHPTNADSSQLCLENQKKEIYKKTKDGLSVRPYVSISPFSLGKRKRKRINPDKIETTMVPSRRFDEILRQHSIHFFDILKVDIEGAELILLEQSSSLIGNTLKPIIIIELTRVYAPSGRGASAALEMFHFFSHDEWIIFKFEKSKYTAPASLVEVKHHNDLPDGSENLICVPRSKENIIKEFIRK